MKVQYEDIKLNKPFRILRPNKDATVWCVVDRGDGNTGLNIFFHAERFWCNPPTDSNMEWHAIQAIEKYGIRYLPEDYAEQFCKLPHAEAWEYAEKIAKEYSLPKGEQ